jgi:dipeptidase
MYAAPSKAARVVVLGAVLAASLVFARTAWASYAFYVGKNLTANGHVLIGGTGEEVSSHYLELVPRRRHGPSATVTVGVTGEASMPGELIEIPQVPETYRYLTMNYTDYLGFPPPLTNGGLNEHGLAVRDVWCTSRQELIELTTTPQRGLNYSDLARIALERAKTAREAVEIAGRLIDEHGYATYGGNSHLFADAEEGWVMIELAGGQGLWVAERLGSDEVRVSYPGYIGEVPEDYLDHPDYMGSDNLISFATEQGWYDPSDGRPFNVHEVYLLQDRAMREPGLKYVSQKRLEDDLAAKAPKITIEDMMMAVRDYRIADDEAGYGQAAELRSGIRPDLRTLWVAPTGSIAAPFIPYRIGMEEIPAEFRQHRYLTRSSGSTFLHPDYMAQEATRFAGRLFKRLLYFTCEHPERFLPEVTQALTAFEAHALAEQAGLEQAAMALFDAGRGPLATEALTFYTTTKAREAMALGDALVGSIEARTKLLYGIREPAGEAINTSTHNTINCRRSGATAAMQAPASPREPPPYPPDQVYGADGERRDAFETAPPDSSPVERAGGTGSEQDHHPARRDAPTPPAGRSGATAAAGAEATGAEATGAEAAGAEATGAETPRAKDDAVDAAPGSASLMWALVGLLALALGFTVGRWHARAPR